MHLKSTPTCQSSPSPVQAAPAAQSEQAPRSSRKRRLADVDVQAVQAAAAAPALLPTGLLVPQCMLPAGVLVPHGLLSGTKERRSGRETASACKAALSSKVRVFRVTYNLQQRRNLAR